MEVQCTADSGLAVTFGSSSDSVPIDKAEERPIISVKEARKLLGKELSDTLTDIDLMEVIKLMYYLANTLMEFKKVPQNTMVEV